MKAGVTMSVVLHELQVNAVPSSGRVFSWKKVNLPFYRLLVICVFHVSRVAVPYWTDTDRIEVWLHRCVDSSAGNTVFFAQASFRLCCDVTSSGAFGRNDPCHEIYGIVQDRQKCKWSGSRQSRSIISSCSHSSDRWPTENTSEPRNKRLQIATDFQKSEGFSTAMDFRAPRKRIRWHGVTFIPIDCLC